MTCNRVSSSYYSFVTTWLALKRTVCFSLALKRAVCFIVSETKTAIDLESTSCILDTFASLEFS